MAVAPFLGNDMLRVGFVFLLISRSQDRGKKAYGMVAGEGRKRVNQEETIHYRRSSAEVPEP